MRNHGIGTNLPLIPLVATVVVRSRTVTAQFSHLPLYTTRLHSIFLVFQRYVVKVQLYVLILSPTVRSSRAGGFANVNFWPGSRETSYTERNIALRKRPCSGKRGLVSGPANFVRCQNAGRNIPSQRAKRCE